MAIKISGPLSTDEIADELGYPLSFTHSFAISSTPVSPSLTHMYRPGNVLTTGVRQTAGFSMSAFYGQAAIYNCIGFSASGGPTGSVRAVVFDKRIQTITFSSDRITYACVRRNWDGVHAITNPLNATWSIGSTCSGVTLDSPGFRVSNTEYGIAGVRLARFNYDTNGETTGNWVLAATNNSTFAGTLNGEDVFNFTRDTTILSYGNTWWVNNYPTGNSNYGRLNQSGRWKDTGSGADALGEWSATFNFFNNSVARRFYIGVGADNSLSLRMNNSLVFAQTTGSIFRNFVWWSIYPITFSSGLNSLVLTGNNAGSFGSLGMEIYGNSEFGMTTSIILGSSGVTPSNLQLFFSTTWTQSTFGCINNQVDFQLNWDCNSLLVTATSFSGGSGQYYISNALESTEEKALNIILNNISAGSFATYSGQITTTYYVGIRDRNDLFNEKIRSITTVNCYPNSFCLIYGSSDCQELCNNYSPTGCD